MAKQTTTGLLTALQFISKVQKDDRGKEKSNLAPNQTHCDISNGIITAFDGSTSIGCKTEVDLECSPHTYTLLDALSKCGQEYSITQQPGRLTVKSGKFSCQVPCIDSAFYGIIPDANCAAVGEVLRESLASVMHLAVEGASRVIESAVLLQSQSAIATNGFVMLETFHGLSLPTMVIPKVFCSALCSVDKKLIGFGYSGPSATFWFDDESWIKTQLFAEQFPDCVKVLNGCSIVPEPLPEGFFEALSFLEPFSSNGVEKKSLENGLVRFSDTGMRVGKDESEGAFYELQGLPANVLGFKIKQLKQVEKACLKVAFDKSLMYCFGNNIRGCVMGVK